MPLFPPSTPSLLLLGLLSGGAVVTSALPPACTAATRPLVVNGTAVPEGLISALAANGGTFASGLDCQWLIVAPDPSTPISLTWGYVDCGNDENCDPADASVTAYEVDSSLSKSTMVPLDEQCYLPELEPGGSDREPVVSMSGRMLVQLVVNAPGTAGGFQAQFTVGSGGGGNSLPSPAASSSPAAAASPAVAASPSASAAAAVPSAAVSEVPPAASASAQPSPSCVRKFPWATPCPTTPAQQPSAEPSAVPSAVPSAETSVIPSVAPSSAASSAPAPPSSPSVSASVSPSASAAAPSASASAIRPSPSTSAAASSQLPSPAAMASASRSPSRAASPSASPSKPSGSIVVPSLPAMPQPPPASSADVALLTLKGELSAWRQAAGASGASGDDSYLYSVASGLSTEISAALGLDSSNGVRVSAYPANANNVAAVLGGCPGDNQGAGSPFRCVIVQLWPASTSSARRQLQQGPSVTPLIQTLRALLADPSSALRRASTSSAPTFGSGLSSAQPWVSGVWATPPVISFVYSGSGGDQLLFSIPFDQTGSKGAHGTGTAAVQQTVTVKNSGGSPLTVFSAATSTVGAGSSNLFALTDPASGAFPVVIGAGQSVAFTVAVTPASVVVPESSQDAAFSVFGLLELQHSLPTGEHTVPLVITVAANPDDDGDHDNDNGDIIPTSTNFKAGVGAGIGAVLLISCVCGLLVWRCCVCCKRRRERNGAIKGGAPSGVKATRLPDGNNLDDEDDDEDAERGHGRSSTEQDKRKKEKAKFKDSAAKAKPKKGAAGSKGRLDYDLDSEDGEDIGGSDSDDNDMGAGSSRHRAGSRQADDKVRLSLSQSASSLRQQQQLVPQPPVYGGVREIELRGGQVSSFGAPAVSSAPPQQPAATWSFPPGVSASTPLPAISAVQSAQAPAGGAASSLRLKAKPHLKAGDFEPCWLRLQSVELFGFSLASLPSQATNELEKLLVTKGIACLASGNVPGAGGVTTYKYYFFAQREADGSALDDSLCLAEVSISPATGAGFRMSCVVKAKDAATASAFAAIFKQGVAPIVVGAV